MEIDIIDHFDDSLRNEWNALLNESVSNVPFLRYDFLKVWWEHLGGGEWNHPATLALIIARQDGKLIGAAPCFVTQHLDRKTLLFLGSIEISDFIDFIVRPADGAAFVAAWMQFIQHKLVPEMGIEAIDLYNLLEDSPTIPLLLKEAESAGLKVERERLQRAPYVPLPGDWEAYLAGIDKKQRHEIRRKIRRAEESELDVSWFILDDGDRLEAAGDDFLNLMAQDRDKQKFLTPSMRMQMKSIMRNAFEQGMLQLAFLKVNGTNAAGYLNFDYNNRIWVYNSGLDYAYMDLSPGWVLLGYLLQWANEKGRSVLDFMRGDEEYKYRFGGIDRYINRLRIEIR